MQKQQKEKDYRPELRKLAKHTWKKTVFTALVNATLLWQAAVDLYFYINFNFLFARRAFFKRSINRAHWVGHQVAKPHRFAFTMLASVVLLGAFILPGELNNIYWVICWGTVFSVFVMAQSFRMVLQKINLIQTR